VIKRKCVSCSYIKDKKKLIIVLKKYYIKVNKLFVFQCFSNVFKRGFYKVEKGSLGLMKKSKVSKKEKVVNKNISKKVYKL
jgi:predicted DNA-binding transcriptional regulator